MNTQEAKFILRAYRPDGRDARDPIFAEPLEQARRDPLLGAWLERERGFDSAVATQLQRIDPPPGLREAILAGGRASRPPRAWWRSPVWAALAASVAIMLSVIWIWSGNRPELGILAQRALDDTAGDLGHHGLAGSLGGVQARLQSSATRLFADFKPDLEQLRAVGCRMIKVGGREVFEICFRRDSEPGAVFHLYIARRSDFRAGPDAGKAKEPEPMFIEKGRLASAMWKDAELVYVVATDAGINAVRRVL